MQVIVNDLYTNYQVLGQAQKSLLILHGWGRNLTDWQYIAQALSSDYQIILLDLPGFGNTQIPQDTFTIFDYADFVQKFLVKTKLRPGYILGHSLGGRIAILLSFKIPNLKKLILVDSAGIEKPKKFLNFISRFKKFTPQLFHKLFFQIFASSDYRNSHQMSTIFKNIISQNLTSYLSKIKTPALIIWGEQDKVLPISLARQYRNQIKNSKLRIVWESGHHPHLEKPNQFLEILKDELE